MTKLLMIVVMLAAVGCKEQSKLDKAPAPETKPAVGSAVGSAAATPPAVEAEAQAKGQSEPDPFQRAARLKALEALK